MTSQRRNAFSGVSSLSGDLPWLGGVAASESSVCAEGPGEASLDSPFFSGLGDGDGDIQSTRSPDASGDWVDESVGGAAGT